MGPPENRVETQMAYLLLSIASLLISSASFGEFLVGLLFFKGFGQQISILFILRCSAVMGFQQNLCNLTEIRQQSKNLVNNARSENHLVKQGTAGDLSFRLTF